jgi:hypothetical protein
MQQHNNQPANLSGSMKKGTLYVIKVPRRNYERDEKHDCEIILTTFKTHGKANMINTYTY